MGCGLFVPISGFGVILFDPQAVEKQTGQKILVQGIYLDCSTGIQRRRQFKIRLTDQAEIVNVGRHSLGCWTASLNMSQQFIQRGVVIADLELLDGNVHVGDGGATDQHAHKYSNGCDPFHGAVVRQDGANYRRFVSPRAGGGSRSR